MAKKRLTWYRWEWRDPYRKELWTACTVSVYEPTYEMPFVSVLISIANGGGRVLMRCASVMEAKHRVGIPEEGMERLELAVTRAEIILTDIKRDLRAIADIRSMAPGSQIVRTDTGEVIAEGEQAITEAERILKEANGH